MGDIAERAGRAVGGALVEGLGDPQMKLSAPPRGKPVVERPAHELVGEAVGERVARNLLDHAARDGLVERRGQRRGVKVPGLANHVGLELRAGDRGQLERSLRRRLEPREPLAHDVAHALGRVERRQRAGEVGPGPGGARLDELAPHLGQEERVPARQLEDRLGQRRAGLDGRPRRPGGRTPRRRRPRGPRAVPG